MERSNIFVKDESGAAAVEYGLLVALIACAIAFAISTLGGGISTMFNSVSGTVAGS